MRHQSQSDAVPVGPMAVEHSAAALQATMVERYKWVKWGVSILGTVAMIVVGYLFGAVRSVDQAVTANQIAGDARLSEQEKRIALQEHEILTLRTSLAQHIAASDGVLREIQKSIHSIEVSLAKGGNK